MARLRLVLVLLSAVVLGALGVFGIVRYHAHPGGIAFHAFVLVCATYLAVTAVRRARG